MIWEWGNLTLSDLFCGYLSGSRVDDEDVSVHGDEEDGEGGEEDAGGLGGPHQLAQHLLQHLTSAHILVQYNLD